MAQPTDRDSIGDGRPPDGTSHTRRTSETEETIAEGVEFAKMIAMSSLGTPEAQDARLRGRKEAESYLAHEVGSSGPLEDGPYDDDIDLAVADELDARGYTFEAELRYRRLAPRSSIAASRLASLLWSKNFRDEALRWYLRAAQKNEPNSIMRLAVICSQRGEQTWALRLLRHAFTQLERSARRHVADQVDYACTARREPSLGGGLARASNRSNIDFVFALGSFFFVIAGRADLARLAYCSALGRGNSLAGVSLLDMTPRTGPVSALGSSGYLQSLLTEGLNVAQYAKYDSPRRYDGVALESYSVLLTNGMQRATIGQICDALRGPSDDPDAADAVERVLINARLFTMLRGYRRFGTEDTLEPIQKAADGVCNHIIEKVSARDVGDGREFINSIWSQTDIELGRIRSEIGSGKTAPAATSAQASTTKKGRVSLVPGAGVAARYGSAFRGLTSDQTRVMAQRVSGLYHQEVADAMGLDMSVTRALYRSGVRRTREIQQGEQIPTSNQLLWKDVESSFTGSDQQLGYHPLDGPDGQVPIERRFGESTS